MEFEFQGKKYYIDDTKKYLYDIVSGEAVAYKKGSTYRMYKKKKGKNT